MGVADPADLHFRFDLLALELGFLKTIQENGPPKRKRAGVSRCRYRGLLSSDGEPEVEEAEMEEPEVEEADLRVRRWMRGEGVGHAERQALRGGAAFRRKRRRG